MLERLNRKSKGEEIRSRRHMLSLRLFHPQTVRATTLLQRYSRLIDEKLLLRAKQMAEMQVLGEQPLGQSGVVKAN